MSDLLSADDDVSARRHAAWALLVLGLVALIVVALMLFVLGTSPSKKSSGGLIADRTTGAPSATSAPPSSSDSPSEPGTSSSALPTPGNTVQPCPTTAACIVSGDVGGVLNAINQLRASHGAPAVEGSVSVTAQQCALQHGEGPSCAPHFAWQPVPKPDGALVVSKIDAQWLLDRSVTSFRVGWAYVPGRAGAGGQWECAVLKFA